MTDLVPPDDAVVVGADVTSMGRFVAVVLVVTALILGPVAVVAMFATVLLVAHQRRYKAQEIAGVASGVLVASIVVMAIVNGNPIWQQLRAMLEWFAGYRSFWSLVVYLVIPSIPFGVPAGVALGAGLVTIFERLAAGSEWHPLEQRRLAVVGQRQLAQRCALLPTSDDAPGPSPHLLGVAADGDLETWRDGPYAVVGPEMANRGLLVVGAAGSGKTVSAERLVTNLACRGRRVVFIDCKGTDPDLAARLESAYTAGSDREDPRVLVFPDVALNGWLGSASDIANRLIATQETSEPYYAATLQTVIRLAVGAPGAGACASSAEFLTRLDPERLTKAYRGHEKAAVVAAVRQDGQSLRGVALRFAGLFDAIAGGFDGRKSWGDADLIILRVPRLSAPADAEAVMKFVLADLSQYCGNPARKARCDDDLTVIVDEYSAITGLAPMVIDLAERVRDVGVQVVVTAQSWEGLGRDDDERMRVRASMASALLHQCPDPERLCEIAGTVRRPEQSWQLEERGHSGLGSMRMGFRMKVDPDLVRRAGVGEAWAISGGRYLHLHVIANRHSDLSETPRVFSVSATTPDAGTVEEPRAEIDPDIETGAQLRLDDLRRELDDDDE